MEETGDICLWSGVLVFTVYLEMAKIFTDFPTVENGKTHVLFVYLHVQSNEFCDRNNMEYMPVMSFPVSVV